MVSLLVSTTHPWRLAFNFRSTGFNFYVCLTGSVVCVGLGLIDGRQKFVQEGVFYGSLFGLMAFSLYLERSPHFVAAINQFFSQETPVQTNECNTLPKLIPRTDEDKFPKLEANWLRGDVVELAQSIRLGGAWSKLPILADALIEAGCDDPELLLSCLDPDHIAEGASLVERIYRARVVEC